MSKPHPAQWSPGAAGPLLRLAEEFASTDLSWMDHGLCAQTDPDSYFVEKGQSTAPAKRTCMRCPVRLICLEYALETDQKFGVWGGASERDRRKIRRQRKAAA